MDVAVQPRELISLSLEWTSKSRASGNHNLHVLSKVRDKRVYGLGYSLLVFVYDKHDDEAASAPRRL